MFLIIAEATSVSSHNVPFIIFCSCHIVKLFNQWHVSYVAWLLLQEQGLSRETPHVRTLNVLPNTHQHVNGFKRPKALKTRRTQLREAAFLLSSNGFTLVVTLAECQCLSHGLYLYQLRGTVHSRFPSSCVRCEKVVNHVCAAYLHPIWMFLHEWGNDVPSN